MKNKILFVLMVVAVLAGCSSQPAVQESAQPAMVSAGQPQPVAAVAQEQAAPQTDTVAKSGDQSAKTDESKTAVPEKPKKPYEPELIKITGTGFGSASSFQGYSPGQRRLMAIRASKLDAYRSLAEQLYGVKIDSNTQLSTLTARSDNFRARVNAIVKGARVVSVTPMPDNNYETVLEVYVDKSFFNNHFVYTNCPDGNCDMHPVEAGNLCGNGYKCKSIDGK